MPTVAPNSLSKSSPNNLQQQLLQRVLIMDGAMGTMVQAQSLQEGDYRGQRFADHPQSLLGNHDVLVLTKPEAIAAVHQKYLLAGADIIETNTFCANAISQQDYGLEDACYDMNYAAARVARESADEVSAQTPEQPRFVLGSIGPTNRMCSMSAKVEDPGSRAIDFDTLAAAYREQIRGLLDGDVDGLLVETVFDTLNCKAALFAMEEEFAQRGTRFPIFVSGTITDASGRTLSGQTVEAFWASISHVPLAAVGLNCALGQIEMRPHLEALAAIADCPVLCYPNAGLPNEMGEYDLSPEVMADYVRQWVRDGLVNCIGGCCGTTPAHIAAMKHAVDGQVARKPVVPSTNPHWAGLERLEIRPEMNFVNIGERTNVTGSRRFARLILAEDYEAALAVAREQVEQGAQALDINMDEGLLDSVAAMRRFLRLLAAEPEIARVPIVLDSSRWEVLVEGLKNVQGRSLVNSLSLKEGEAEFRSRATHVLRMGAAVVVMAFDEEGQAVDVDRRVAIVDRAMRILREVGFRDQDVVLDLNVLAIATGMEEHNSYAQDFLEALRLLKEKYPLCSFSGGISNLSFSFRGADAVRQAMHAVFLYHAVQAGLTMGIVHAGRLPLYDDLDAQLRTWCEDVILNRRPQSAEDLMAYAENHRGEDAASSAEETWRQQDVHERLAHALIHGITEYLEHDLPEALSALENPLDVIEGPLMAGMGVVGERFGSGRMFLPQVVKSARVMKRAVAWLEPHLETAKKKTDVVTEGRGRGKILLATVKGDVHDIGKNIVSVILACNGYQVFDLGVMVPAETILQKAKEESVDLIGLSGLITPSLDEMIHVADALQRDGFDLPLMIGGATTSLAHTAVRIAPGRHFPVVHARDASDAVAKVQSLLAADSREEFWHQEQVRMEKARHRHSQRRQSLPLSSLEEARKRAPQFTWQQKRIVRPRQLGVQVLRNFSLQKLREFIDWTPFFSTWEMKGRYPAILQDSVRGKQAQSLLQDAEKMLDSWSEAQAIQAHAVFGLFPANSKGDDLLLHTAQGTHCLPMLRQQRHAGENRISRCLADFVAPEDSGCEDYLGVFAVSAGFGLERWLQKSRIASDDYGSIMAKALADRLAEALAEYLHAQVRREYWGYAVEESLTLEAIIEEKYRGIRPAPGYPACPDHSLKQDIFEILGASESIGVSLTENFAMLPAASVCGFYFAHPESCYFGVGRIQEDQIRSYAERRGITEDEARVRLATQLSSAQPAKT